MTGRPLEFNPDEVLESAMQLFWSKGYRFTSLQLLIATMGISKSSFYQAFGSKHVIFQSCIKRYRLMLIEMVRAQLKQSNSGKQFIETIFSDAINQTEENEIRRGCLLMNTASEFAQTDPVIADLITASLDELTDLFESAIIQAQQEGDISYDKNAHLLAVYLVSSISGLKCMVKAGVNEETASNIAKATTSLLFE